jgi:hypothetical protein
MFLYENAENVDLTLPLVCFFGTTGNEVIII